MLQLRNRLRKIEEDFKITSEKLESEKEERVELGRVYNDEKRNAEQLRRELEKMDEEIQSKKSEAKDLQDKSKDLEEHRRYELRGRSPEGSEIGEEMWEEIRRLRLALDGKINELKKFKEGYSNSKMEHERVKKGLNKKD